MTGRREDAEAFREFVDPYLQELHLHCYRMLGSVDDADDLLQETLLAAWRGLSDFAGRSSPRTWLYRIATNRCLNAIRHGSRRPPVVPVPPFDPPPSADRHPATWLQPYLTADEPAEAVQRREHVELAFITALQLLPPRQTAALLLVDVLGFSIGEAAELLDAGATAVKGLLQRARAGVEARGAEARGAPRPEPAPSPDRAVAERFADAFVRDDVEAVLSVLTDRCWWAMPPAPHLYRGPQEIGAFLQASIGWRRGSRSLAVRPVRANAAPAYLVTLSGATGPQPAGTVVLDVGGDRITGVTRFLHTPAPAALRRESVWSAVFGADPHVSGHHPR